MNRLAFFLVGVFFPFMGCTMFERTDSSNELESLTKDVLNKREGVQIDVKPIAR